MLLKFEKIGSHWHAFSLERLLIGQALIYKFTGAESVGVIHPGYTPQCYGLSDIEFHCLIGWMYGHP